MISPRLRVLVVAALAVLLGRSGRAAASWRTCGDGSLAVTDASVVPDPAVPGSPVSFQIRGRAAEEVADGQLAVSVRYMGLRVYTKDGPLCSTLHCPLEAGEATLTFQESLPAVAPPVSGAALECPSAVGHHGTGVGVGLWCVTG